MPRCTLHETRQRGHVRVSRTVTLGSRGLSPSSRARSVVAEMRRRLQLTLACAAPDWDHECCVCCCDITPDNAFLLRPCGHLFHDECIAMWLRERASCPLCRGPASLSQLCSLHSVLAERGRRTITITRSSAARVVDEARAEAAADDARDVV